MALVVHLGLAPFAMIPWISAVPSNEGATTYYVDAAQGKDSYSGRLAEPDVRQTDGPLRSIQVAYDRLRSGDTLMIKQGVYRETVTLYKTASQEEPVLIQAFPGDEQKVVISGADVCQGWKACPNQASCGGNPNWGHLFYFYVKAGTEVTQLFQGGSRLRPSRYPDRGWQYPASAAPGEPNRAFVDTRLRARQASLVGSLCNVRTKPWNLDQIRVSAYAPVEGKATLASPTRYPLSPDTGYYLTHLVSEINEPGEWAFDRQQGRVVLWPLAGLPEDVEATAREAGIDTGQHCAYHTISGLAVRYAGHGIRICDALHVTVKANLVDSAYSVGILDSNSADSAFLENTIQYTGYTGIEQDALCSGGLIQGNSIYATGAENLGDDLVCGNALGIAVNGRGTRVLYNRIDRSGYNGLYAGRGDTSGREIAYNYITHSCLALSDGAAIYTDGHSNSSEPDVFHHNIIADVWGWPGGWARHEVSDPGSTSSSREEAYGIYVDEQSNNRIFEYNTIRDCGTAGMLLHWTQDNRLAHNTLFGNGEYQLLLSGKEDPRFILRGNATHGNLFIATAPDQKTLQVNLDYSDLDFGDCDDNRYYHPENQRHLAVSKNLGGTPCTVYSLPQWRQVTGKDANSVDLSPSGGQAASSSLPILLDNPSTAAVVIDLAGQEYVDAEGRGVKAQVTLGPFESLVLFPRAVTPGEKGGISFYDR
jgi:parallel beta-helix repeat protein